jgi:hypothetical protein
MPNALSKRRCANEATQELIRPQVKEPRSCQFGRTITIGIARTEPKIKPAHQPPLSRRVRAHYPSRFAR